jgi:diguanylate cyclase (GGDEF)-like protein
VAFFVIVVSILVANVRFGFARIATSDTMGGLLSRWLLPTIPIMLFTLGWLRLEGEKAGLYEFQFGVALMVLMSIVVCVIAVAWTAIILHRIDITRQKGEAEIWDLNAGLEQRVRERTEELGKLSQELSNANRALERLSQEDGLTGLANRRHFDTYLNSQIAIARRYRRPLALVLCDIDAFKAFNDNYGHPAGDECLKKIAAALQTCCRRPSDMVARYGGEEFAIVLPDTDLAGAGRIAETARDAVAQLNIPHVHSPAAAYVRISGGVAVALRDAENAEQLIAVADKALYDAKHQGRNRVVRAQVEVANLPREGKAFRGKPWSCPNQA